MTWERALAEMPSRRSGGELGEVLVGHDDGQPVGAGLGEHVLQRVGQVQEVLALVDVQGGVGPGVLGEPGAAGGGLPGPGDQERPDQLRGLLAQGALGQPGQQQARRLSRTADMSKVDGPAAIACRANFRSRNARSLFISGPATAACEAGDSSSHQDQNPRSTGSRMVAVTRRRMAWSASRAGMSARVT